MLSLEACIFETKWLVCFDFGPPVEVMRGRLWDKSYGIKELFVKWQSFWALRSFLNPSFNLCCCYLQSNEILWNLRSNAQDSKIFVTAVHTVTVMISWKQSMEKRKTQISIKFGANLLLYPPFKPNGLFPLFLRKSHLQVKSLLSFWLTTGTYYRNLVIWKKQILKSGELGLFYTKNP